LCESDGVQSVVRRVARAALTVLDVISAVPVPGDPLSGHAVALRVSLHRYAIS
jgi:hypothetical protein